MSFSRCSLLLLLLWASPAHAQWVESTIVGTHTGDVQAVYIGGDFPNWRDSQAYPWMMNVGQWYRLTLPVPDDTTSVDLQGILITSNGPAAPYGSVICNLTATFRAPDAALACGNYQLQTDGLGPRTMAYLNVPVSGRQIDFCYSRVPGCESLINLKLDKYYRSGIVAPPPPPVITTTVQGGNIVVTVHGPGNMLDWVGLYSASNPSPQAYLGWQYLSGSHVVPTPTANATLTFPAPPGHYVMQFFADNGFTLIGASSVVVP